MKKIYQKITITITITIIITITTIQVDLQPTTGDFCPIKKQAAVNLVPVLIGL